MSAAWERGGRAATSIGFWAEGGLSQVFCPGLEEPKRLQEPFVYIVGVSLSALCAFVKKFLNAW
jgi:hypothetical protein